MFISFSLDKVDVLDCWLKVKTMAYEWRKIEDNSWISGFLVVSFGYVVDWGEEVSGILKTL